jgi:hypothetical protein
MVLMMTVKSFVEDSLKVRFANFIISFLFKFNHLTIYYNLIVLMMILKFFVEVSITQI